MCMYVPFYPVSPLLFVTISIWMYAMKLRGEKPPHSGELSETAGERSKPFLCKS